MNFTRRVLSCVLFAACVMTANAVERLMVVGDGVWGGWSISNSIVMFNTAEQPDVWKATVNLRADADFKFLTEARWGGLEFRAGDNNVVLTTILTEQEFARIAEKKSKLTIIRIILNLVRFWIINTWLVILSVRVVLVSPILDLMSAWR